jgi:hypothetical protein
MLGTITHLLGRRDREPRRCAEVSLCHAAPVFLLALVLVFVLVGCRTKATTPAPVLTPTAVRHTPTPTATAITGRIERQPFRTYAHGEFLPDMRVPIQRSATGEGGWYTIIGSAEGWNRFLSQMGQPPEIWEPVRWEEEILIGALLGVRSGRGYGITIVDVRVGGVTVQVQVAFDSPAEQPTAPWITYPFHFVRVPRLELPLGSVTFEFVSVRGEGLGSAVRSLASQIVDTVDLSIVWLPGEQAVYPTPTPVQPTLTPEPTPSSTPVPGLRVTGTVLEVMVEALRLRIVPAEGEWEYVNLVETTSILQADGQSTTLSQVTPGTVIEVIGYASEPRSIQAAHLTILRFPTVETAFAPYRPRSVTLSTIYNGYELPLSAEEISTTLPLSQTLDPAQSAALLEEGFVVVPAEYETFAAAYGDTRYITYPVFISADSILQVSQLLFDRVWHSVERTHLRPELLMLEREMFDHSWAQYETARSASTSAGLRVADAALRNAVYFAVPLSLLDPTFTAPEVISPAVSAELSLIAASQGITVSPSLAFPDVFDEAASRLDYGKFACQACAGDEAMLAYYRATTWHRQVSYHLAEPGDALSAALMALTLKSQTAPRVLWRRVQAPLVFFQGQEASLTLEDWDALLAEAWGDIEDVVSLGDEAKLAELVRAIRSLPPPENTMWPWVWDWRPGRQIAREWTFLPRPFVIDSYVFDQVTGDNVGDAQDRRPLPSSIDLAAVLGSLEAYRIALEAGDAAYEDYIAQVDKVRNELVALADSRWTEELYWNWLYVYRALTQDKTPSYPVWMRTTAWRRRELQTMFGSWVSVRHQADRGAARPSEEEGPASPWGYVEPQPEVYARLAALVRLIIDGLDSRLMLSAANRDALLDLEAWMIFIQDVSRRELTGQALAAEEYKRLGEYGRLIGRLSQTAAGEPAVEGQEASDGGQARVVISVAASDKEQRIEAVGFVDEIYVVVERGREWHLARGGVYSHYEMAWPVEEALTDALWREMLDSGEQPARPQWVQGFVVQ